MKNLTPTLRALLAQYQSTLPTEEYTAFVAYLEQLSATFRAELEAEPAGPLRARKLHALMEIEMSAIGDARPSCGHGCSACCHLEVELTADEGMLLASLVEAGHPIDRDRLAEQASRPRLSERWAAKGTPENRCVFLGEAGACSVYEDRPAACRKLLVVSPPRECAKPDGVVVPITVPIAEVLLSAAISLPGAEFMSVSKGVLRALDAATP